MSVISIKELLEAGVHFGHMIKKYNPKMAEYIYLERNGIHIFDLQKTEEKINEAYRAVSEAGKILFIGTKKNAKEPIKEEAERCGMQYINDCWVDGTIIDFKNIKVLEYLPDILFIVDPGTEHRAVKEAREMGIPIVAIVDTNSDPDDADYVIPGNDDAICAIKLITGKIADAIIDSK